MKWANPHGHEPSSGFMLIPGNVHKKIMLFDVFFLGLPVMFGLMFGYFAVKEASIHFWRPTFCIVAYSTYYIAGGREVVLYFTTAAMMAFGWVSIL